MRYFAKFNQDGERITSIVEGVHFEVIPEHDITEINDKGETVIIGHEVEKIDPQIQSDFVEITEEEQQLYQTNKYIRGIDGKPQKKPPYQPTTQDKANQIKQKYEQQITELKDALATATLANDTNSIEELKKEYAELMKKYESELEGFNNAEKV